MAHKSKLFTLNTPLFKDLTLIFHWKELTPLVQIPHPSQARFKFSTPAKQGSNSPPQPSKVQIPYPSQERFKFPTPAKQGSNSPPLAHQ